jgi:NTE family protein
MRPKSLARLVVTALAGASIGAAAQSAAETAEAPRPRVGLVLGGGGARGAAHIGVLEVLERLRVPVDCVAGTSMGGLVAGAFAAGLTPAQMREALAKADWADMFQDNPEFFDMSYRNKRLSQGFLPGTELGVTPEGLTYAPGVVTGQKIKAFFNQLVHDDRGERLIEELPLKLSIVATDIGTGQRVVMREGSLTQAMRASMSVPGLMAPVERDGKKLVDGGLVDNVPIREVRERCNPDVVIAVNVGSPLLKAEDIGSLFSVTAQMVNILTEQNVTQSLATLKPGDIYIHPDLQGITSGSFERNAEAADRGRSATAALQARLAPLGVSDTQYARWLTRVDVPEAPPQRVDAIEIGPLAQVNPADVKRSISQPVGQPLDTGKLDRDLLRVFGEGYYERVDYSLVREGDRNVLRVLPVEKSWGPNYLRLGLGLESNMATGATYTLRAAYQKTWLNALGAELLTVAEIGNRSRLGVDFFQPLDGAQRYFVQVKAAYQRESIYVFEDDNKLAELSVYELGGELLAGLRVGGLGQLRLGWAETAKRGTVDVGPPQVPAYRVSYGGWFVSTDLDHMDRIYLPRDGWSARARYFDAPSQGFSKLDADLRGAISSGKWIALGRLGYTGSPSGQLPFWDAAKLGGFMNLSAFARSQWVGDDSTYAGVRVERVIGTMPLGIRGDIRLGGAVEAGKMSGAYTETNLRGWQNSVAFYLGGETPIGAIFLGAAYSPSSGYSNVYFLLGTP